MCDFADKCKFVCIVSAKKEGGPVMAGWLPSKRPHNHRLLLVSTNPTGKCWWLSENFAAIFGSRAEGFEWAQ